MKSTPWFKLVKTYLAAALLAALLFPACTNVQVTGDGKVIGEYKLGYLNVEASKPLADVREATRQAFRDLRYFQVADQQQPGEAVLRARDPHDTLVEVKLKDFTSYTNVKIHCGIVGDLAQSQQVYQAIAKRL